MKNQIKSIILQIFASIKVAPGLWVLSETLFYRPQAMKTCKHFYIS